MPLNLRTGSDAAATRTTLTPWEERVQAHMRRGTFGVEFETLGRTRKVVAERLAKHFGTEALYLGGGYDKWTVPMGPNDARVWTVLRDGSLTNADGASAEIVSPILTLEDMDALQGVVRALRKMGCKADSSCGMHVHVGAKDMTVLAAANLATRVSNYDAIWGEQLGIVRNRREDYCKPLPGDVVVALRDLGAAFPEAPFRSDIGATLFFGAMGPHSTDENWRRTTYPDRSEARRAGQHHYHPSRYYGLNLHAVFYHGTVEFRWFEATLHAGEVRAAVLLALGLVAGASNIPWTQMGAFSVEGYEGPRRTARRLTVAKALLDVAGLVGPVFGTARGHLLKRISPAHAAALAEGE